MRMEDIHRLQAFDHICFREIVGVLWNNRGCIVEIRDKVPGKEEKSVDEVINRHRFVCL